MSIIGEMIGKYVSDPKPVIWGSTYKPLLGEKRNTTLRRCYPKLLNYRKKLYKKLSDITIDHYFQTKEDFSACNLSALIAKNQRV